jgi:hypothetical protein
MNPIKLTYASWDISGLLYLQSGNRRSRRARRGCQRPIATGLHDQHGTGDTTAELPPRSCA